MAKDDESRLQRSLNSLERRNQLARRKDDDPADPASGDDTDAVDDVPYSMAAMSDGAHLRKDDQGRPTTDGMPPRAPGGTKPSGVHTDLAAAIAALRHLASSRPGFDIMVFDPSTDQLAGTRITSVKGNSARVSPVTIELDDEGVPRAVVHDEAAASELAAMLRRRDR